MASLINTNTNQNYFQFHGPHYKYEKGISLGLPLSRSIFKNTAAVKRVTFTS